MPSKLRGPRGAISTELNNSLSGDNEGETKALLPPVCRGYSRSESRGSAPARPHLRQRSATLGKRGCPLPAPTPLLQYDTEC